MGAMRFQSSVLSVGEIPERIETAAISPAVFQLLGMKPAMGRSFAPDEDQPDKNQVAILSAGLWQRRFGRDPNILGKTVLLDGGSFVIIGVAPPAFQLPTSQSELWIPYTPEPKDLLPSSRGVHQLYVLARLKPGMSRERAQSEMRIIAQRLAQRISGYQCGLQRGSGASSRATDRRYPAYTVDAHRGRGSGIADCLRQRSPFAAGPSGRA